MRRAPSDPDADRFIPVFGIARPDLDGDGECTLTLMNLGWADYDALRQRARLHLEEKEPFQDLGEELPLVVLSGPTDLAREVAGKLQAAEPLGIAFSEKDGVLAMILGGLQDTYLLTEFDAEREQVVLWWHRVTTYSGAYAVVVSDTAPDGSGLWDPLTVEAVFELGRQTFA